MTNLPLTYDINAAAARLGGAFTVEWLRKRVNRGEIPHGKNGAGRGKAGRIYFTDAHLAEIIAMYEVRPASVPKSGIVTRRRGAA